MLPGKVRDQQAGMHYQANAIVHQLVFAERLMTALMGDNPQASADSPLEEPVNWP
jgi:hypothetical protein